MAQSKPKQRGVGCSPFKRRDEKYSTEKYELPLVGFNPEAAKQRRSFVYEDPALESSEVVTPISPHALKLFEAIREDEMELVEAELSTLTDKREIDKLGGHGFALIHVAARYNFSRIVTTLLDHGANINVGTSDYQWTPLHLAARCVETFKTLYSTLRLFRPLKCTYYLHESLKLSLASAIECVQQIVC